MPHNTNGPAVPTPPLPPNPATPPELLLLHPHDIQAPEELNTRRFQTSRESILSLAFSLLSEGQKQPVGVTLMPDSTYLLRWGWRRWQAACLINDEQLGMGFIEGPYELLAIVNPYTPQAKHQPSPELLDGIVENAQRAELGPVDQAYAIQQLAGTGMSQRNIAQKINLSLGLVSQRLRLLQLPASVQRGVNSGEISVDMALRTLDQPEGPRRDAAIESVRELFPPSPSPISDKDVGSVQSLNASDTGVLNKTIQPKEDKQPKSKTAKQMIVELEGYATPEEGDRTPAQTWVLTKLIPWIRRSGRPFRAAMEGLERLAK